MDCLTQAQLGERFGVRQQTIGAWEHGERPQSRFFGVLANYIGLEERELVSLIDSQSELPIGGAEVGEAQDELADNNDLVMRQLAQSYMEAQRRGSLSPQAAEAYSKLFEYFGRPE